MFEMYDSIHEEINYELEHKALLQTPDHLQLVYEQYCIKFNSTPLSIWQYFHNGVLSYDNYILNMN